MARKLFRNRSKFILIPAAIILAGILFNAARVQYDVLKTRGYIKKLEQKIGKLEQENASILGLIESVLNDPVKIEREARSRLNLKKSGEEVIILIPQQEDKNKQNGEDKEKSDSTEESFLTKFWKIIFGDKK